jgi:hypothetical protein
LLKSRERRIPGRPGEVVLPERMLRPTLELECERLSEQVTSAFMDAKRLGRLVQRLRGTSELQIDMAQVMQRVALTVTRAHTCEVHPRLFKVIRRFRQVPEFLTEFAKVIERYSVQGRTAAHQVDV